MSGERVQVQIIRILVNLIRSLVSRSLQLSKLTEDLFNSNSILVISPRFLDFLILHQTFDQIDHRENPRKLSFNFSRLNHSIPLEIRSRMYGANRRAIKRYLMSRQMTCLSHISPTRTLRKAAEKAPNHHHRATRKESFYRAGSPPDPTNSRRTTDPPVTLLRSFFFSQIRPTLSWETSGKGASASVFKEG